MFFIKLLQKSEGHIAKILHQLTRVLNKKLVGNLKWKIFQAHREQFIYFISRTKTGNELNLMLTVGQAADSRFRSDNLTRSQASSP